MYAMYACKQRHGPRISRKRQRWRQMHQVNIYFWMPLDHSNHPLVDAKIVDQFSHKTWTANIKPQAQIAEMLKQHLDTMHSQGKQVQYLHCNNVPEHGAKLANICKEQGFEIEFTVPYTPQHNGMVECKIVTDCDHALAMLFGARLTKTAQGLL